MGESFGQVGSDGLVRCSEVCVTIGAEETSKLIFTCTRAFELTKGD